MTTPSSPGPASDAQLARRRRLTYAGMAVLVLGVTAYHAYDAHRQGQSMWPVLGALPVLGLVIWLTSRFLARPIDGLEPAEARRTRAQQLMRRAAPLAIGCLLLVVLLRGCQGH
jgi:hypothetical protein